MNLRLGLLLLPVLLVGMAGCGPIYDTHYDLIPPTDDAGRFCTVECERLQLDCRRVEDRKSQDCNRDRQDAQSTYQRCLDKHNNDSNQCRGLSPNPYCPSANYSACDTGYRRCFQNCGGQVHSRQVCVFNCP